MRAPRRVASPANALVKDLRRLAHDPAAYRKLGRVWLEGDHLARAYLARGGRPRVAVFSEAAWAEPAWRTLGDAADEVVLLAEPLWAACSTLETPAAAALGLLVDLPGRAAPVLPAAPSVVLDRVQDAGNVGAIIRSAAALGVAQVLALKGTAALWSPKVLRAGMGAHFGLQLREGLGLDDLQALQVPLLATSSHGSQALHRIVLPQPAAWVFGHEGQGVGDALAARCTLTLTIPQPGGEESLNVAAAAAICLYESLRQRQP
ncbi:MAG: RNA methyltransferase [Burkholderiales bacterium]